jgi:BlaI family penicillinase repressor
MARPTSEVLTEREAQIMSILWEMGHASSEKVRERLAGDPHDSTVRTLLRVLRPTIYRPAIAQSKVQQKATRGVLQRFFGGSAETLVLRLLEDEHLTPEQLEQLKQSHSRRSRKRGKP